MQENVFFLYQAILRALLFLFLFPYFCIWPLQYFIFLLYYSKSYFLSYKVCLVLYEDLV